MKIFGPRSLSHVLFYLFIFIGATLLTLFFYLVISFISGNFKLVDERYSVQLPLVETAIEGPHQVEVMITVCLTLLFLGCLIFSLATIFKALSSSHIFTPRLVKSLRIFTILNLIIGPIIYLLVTFLILQRTYLANAHNLILLLIFGVIGLFLTHIFKKGMQVQQENDLTI